MTNMSVEMAFYEMRITGMMETIANESGYLRLLELVRDVMRRHMVAGGQSEQYADSYLVMCAHEVTDYPTARGGANDRR